MNWGEGQGWSWMGSRSDVDVFMYEIKAKPETSNRTYDIKKNYCMRY